MAEDGGIGGKAITGVVGGEGEAVVGGGAEVDGVKREMVRERKWWCVVIPSNNPNRAISHTLIQRLILIQCARCIMHYTQCDAFKTSPYLLTQCTHLK